MATAGQGQLSDSDLFLEYTLRMTKGRIRLIGLASAALLILAVGAVFLLAVVMADHFLPGGLPAGARAIFRWALLLAEAGLVAAMILIPLARRINDLYVARLIEKAHPNFRNDLTAALQLAGDRRVHTGTLAAIRRRAAREVFQTDVESSVKSRDMAISGMVFGAAAGAFLIYCLASSKPILPSLQRALGRDDVPAPTRTAIEPLQPGADRIVLVGQSVDFVARVRRGRGPVTVRISRDGGTTWLNDDALTMRAAGASGDGAEQYLATWPSAAPVKDNAATFIVACGDAQSRPGTFTVLPRPVIRQLTATYRWPDYTGRGQTQQTGGQIDLEALKGTVVVLQAETNLPIERASLVFEKAPATIMTVSGRTATAQFTIQDSDRFHIAFQGGHELIRGQSPWGKVSALEDAPPVVKVTEPVRKAQLAVNDVFRLAGEVMDDFGFTDVALVAELPGGRTSRIPLKGLGFAPPGVPARPIEMSRPAGDLGQVGQRLTCRVEARDFCPPNGQVGRSEPFELVIAKPDEDIAAQAQAAEEARRQREAEAAQAQAEAPTQAATSQPQDARQAADELIAMAQRDVEALNKLQEHLGAQAGDPGAQGQAAGEPGAQAGPGQKPDTGGQGAGGQAGQAAGGQGAGGQGAAGQGAGGQGAGGQGAGGQGAGGQGAAGQGAGGQGAAGQGAGGQSAGGQGAGGQGTGGQGAGGQGTGGQGTGGQGAGGQGAGGQGAGGQGTGGQGAGGQGAGGQGAGGQGAAGQGAGGQGAGGQGAGGQGPGGQGPGGQGAGGQGAGGGGATGVHSGVAGGDPNSGSASDRGDVAEPTGPLLSAAQQANLQSIGRLISEAQKDLRAGKVDENLLKSLGMTREQFAAFVESYAQRIGKVEKMRPATSRPTGSLGGAFSLSGSDRRQQGRGLDGAVENMQGSEKLSPDEVRKLYEDRAKKVSPEFRKPVEAYFRAVSEGAAAVRQPPATAPVR